MNRTVDPHPEKKPRAPSRQWQVRVPPTIKHFAEDGARVFHTDPSNFLVLWLFDAIAKSPRPGMSNVDPELAAAFNRQIDIVAYGPGERRLTQFEQVAQSWKHNEDSIKNIKESAGMSGDFVALAEEQYEENKRALVKRQEDWVKARGGPKN